LEAIGLTWSGRIGDDENANFGASVMSPRSDRTPSKNLPKKAKKQSRKPAMAASRTDAQRRKAKKTKETPPSWAKALSYVPRHLK
jgi:hypothetical protein